MFSDVPEMFPDVPEMFPDAPEMFFITLKMLSGTLKKRGAVRGTLPFFRSPFFVMYVLRLFYILYATHALAK
jgi:hypothetical protein